MAEIELDAVATQPRPCPAETGENVEEEPGPRRLFRTDGVRGVAGQDLTADLALDLGVAAAAVLGGSGEGRSGTPVAVVGRDPRVSGGFLEAAVVAGLASAGVDVLRLGVVPRQEWPT